MDWRGPSRTADDTSLGPPSVTVAVLLRQSYWEVEPNPAPYGLPQNNNKQTKNRNHQSDRRGRCRKKTDLAE